MNWWFLLLPLPLFSTYFIAIKKNEGDVLGTLNVYTPLIPPKGKDYADPCLFEHEGTHYVFFEDYDNKKGVISYVTIGENIELSNPSLALELPCHLSFPNFFTDEGEIYMIPETYSDQSVSLFRAVQFPNRWEKKRILIEGEKFSDPILFKHEGIYWLFAATHRDRLAIFYAPNLNSPFLPHPINQQRLRGRNGGPVFFLEGRFIRPTMDCKISYGRSVIFKEILLLTPTEFVETEIGTMKPTWAPGLKGTHAYSQNDQYVVYDGQL